MELLVGLERELLWPGDYRRSELRFIKMGLSYEAIPEMPVLAYFHLWPRYHPRTEFHEKSPGPNYRSYRGHLNYGSSAYGVVINRNNSKSRITWWTDVNSARLVSDVTSQLNKRQGVRARCMCFYRS